MSAQGVKLFWGRRSPRGGGGGGGRIYWETHQWLGQGDEVQAAAEPPRLAGPPADGPWAPSALQAAPPHLWLQMPRPVPDIAEEHT